MTLSEREVVAVVLPEPKVVMAALEDEAVLVVLEAEAAPRLAAAAVSAWAAAPVSVLEAAAVPVVLGVEKTPHSPGSSARSRSRSVSVTRFRRHQSPAP